MNQTTLQPCGEVSFEEQDAHIYRMKSFWSGDMPWYPRAAIVPNISGNHAELDYNTLDPQFQIFQSHQTISECDTFPQDSAYGSGPTILESVPSLCEVELSGQYDQMPLDPTRTQIDQLCGGIRVSLSDLSPKPRFAPKEPLRARSGSKLRCSVCQTDVKTKAQLKSVETRGMKNPFPGVSGVDDQSSKHNQRHGKPHLCPYQGCKRSNQGCGFGTPNDLLRHKRTVHREFDVNGPPFYVCTHEPCRSKKTQKRWPRADNFRQHLSRQHSDLFRVDDDLQGYIYRHPEARRSDLQGVGQGIGPLEVDISQVSPFLEGEQAFPDESLLNSISQEPAMAFASVSGQISSYPEWPQSLVDLVMTGRPNAANEFFAGQFPDLADDFSHDTNDVVSESLESPAPSQPQDDLLRGNLPDSEDYLDNQSRGNGAWAAPNPAMDANALDIDDWSSALSESGQTTDEYASDLTADALERDLIGAQSSNTSRIIKILQSLPPQLLKTALRRDQESEDEEAERDEDKPSVKDKAQAQTSSRANYKCLECPKAFGRQCELKKHSKRHAKPYGCTFKDCDKTFGSKNDWKRHESNQHSTLETWTCDMPECRAVRHRQESFRNHLVKDHHLANQSKLLEEKLERCRMGRHCDPRFWCGFCVEVIEIKEAGVNAWKRRCDHIDNHLWGKEGLTKKKMEDWVFVNDGRKSLGGGGENCPVQTGGKRKVTDTMERPWHKKQKEGSLMWYCCNCPNPAGAVLKLSSSCLECHHMKCLHCTQEMVTTDD